MEYTLLFGNNFVSGSPILVKLEDKSLFSLGFDPEGPFLVCEVFDSQERLLIKMENNICTFVHENLIVQKNERAHAVVKNANGEIMLESRVLDKKTLLVAGIFSFREFRLVATQNYLVLPSGKWMMHNKVNAGNGPVLITETGIKSAQ